MTFITQANSCTANNNSSSPSPISSPANNGISNTASTNTLKKKTPNANDPKRNTLRILINATMQLLTSPPISPSTSEEHCTSPSSESSYFSFPEYEEFDYDEINDEVVDIIGSRGEIENLIVQMEKFDEMLVNGIRVNN